MTYKPTAEDFQGIESTGSYKPTAEDFMHDSKSEQPVSSKRFTGLAGLGEDTANLFKNALSGALGFAARLPRNLKEVGSELASHPIAYPPHVARQVLAGLGNTAKSAANTPHELVEALRRNKITPDWLVTGKIPEDLGIENTLGLEATKDSDELLRALPALAGAGTAVSTGLKKIFKAPDLKGALKETQAKLNTATDTQGKTFDMIEGALAEKGKNIISIDKGIIEKAKRFMEDTPEAKELIQRASQGDYKALRNLQSDLRVKAEEALSAGLSTETTKGRTIGSIRNRINNAIKAHLDEVGEHKLADLLAKNKNAYREAQKTYFSSPALTRVFGESQKIPKNPLTLLTEDSTEMNRFMSAHPEIKKLTEKALKHDKKIKALKKVGYLGTAAIGGAEASHLLHR